jgi:hypothetical protein
MKCLSKKCTKCDSGKPNTSEFFHQDRYTSDGLTLACKECRLQSRRLYRQNSLDKEREYSRSYMVNFRTNNPEKMKEQKYKSERKRKQERPKLRARYNLRRRLAATVTQTRMHTTLQLVGCTLQELRTHLENQFIDGMSWKNYGLWHIDHIKPCAKFDLTNANQQRECFHFTNLQPLWAVDNLRKSDK